MSEYEWGYRSTRYRPVMRYKHRGFIKTWYGSFLRVPPLYQLQAAQRMAFTWPNGRVSEISVQNEQIETVMLVERKTHQHFYPDRYQSKCFCAGPLIRYGTNLLKHHPTCPIAVIEFATLVDYQQYPSHYDPRSILLSWIVARQNAQENPTVISPRTLSLLTHALLIEETASANGYNPPRDTLATYKDPR